MEDLIDVAVSARSFAADAGMALVPAAPLRDCGHEVRFDARKVPLPDFLALAAKLGGGVLYCEAEPFDPQGDPDLAELPEHLAVHSGKVGLVRLAFAANGIVHFWERETPWHTEVEDIKDSRLSSLHLYGEDRLNGDGDGREDHESERLDAETRARLAGELAAQLLALPEFRAAKGGARQRIGRMSVREDTHEWVSWDAVRQACDQAEALSGARYGELADQLDDLAAELLTDAAYRKASSAAARRQAAEQFLVRHADGFSPPAHLRDELHARAQKLAKANQSSALF